MSKIGNIVMDLQDLAQEMGIENEVTNLTESEKEAMKANLRETIRTNSCEADCPHHSMLGLL